MYDVGYYDLFLNSICCVFLCIISVLCPSYLILCTMTALSMLACCRVSVGSLSSLLGNIVINT